MDYYFKTSLKGSIALSDTFLGQANLNRDKTLYKFIWVREGTLSLEVDHIGLTISKDEILPLTPLHHLAVAGCDAEYVVLLFNSNFYCIYGHDNEVSCSGLLFNGSSPSPFRLDEGQSAQLYEITDKLRREYGIRDTLQEEMLRILLKRFIITCTRVARECFSVASGGEKRFDVVRRFYVLVDDHFREKKQVQEYADMLCRSPKTLSNLFASYGLPSPLHIIRERTATEAKRLLLYSSRSVKEIAGILGFEDTASFSRFFRSMAGESTTEFRKLRKREK